MHNLDPIQLAAIKNILATHIPAAEVRALDPSVSWVAREPLDLALVVMGDEALDSDIRETLEAALTAAPEFDKA